MKWKWGAGGGGLDRETAGVLEKCNQLYMQEMKKVDSLNIYLIDSTYIALL